MTWPQMSDLKGWESSAAAVYGIRSIPSNILIDPQGKIVAMDLRENRLQEVLAEAKLVTSHCQEKLLAFKHTLPVPQTDTGSRGE